MQKRVFTYLIITLLAISYFSILTFAQENSTEGTQTATEEQTQVEQEETTDETTDNTIEQDSEKEIEKLIKESETFDEELTKSAGITPDSVFYFLDGIIDSREEKVAEMKTMAEECNQGNENACQGFEVAFEKYKEHADELEKEVSPEEREDAERSSRAIRGTMINDIAKNIDPTKKDELVREVVKKEKNIEIAAEIASKIANLCKELAELSPEDFYKTCKTEDDSPKWQKDMFDKLTMEQKKEANQFINVITKCFEDPVNCKCEESTKIESFVEQCKIISEAEAKCRQGDNTACNLADETGDKIYDSLASAPHLLKALQLIERKFDDFENDRFENRMPPECEEAGATSPDECRKIMIETHAPEECREELKKAAPKNEREARVICEEIMFELNAPEECVEAGLKDHKECGKFMFQQNAPQECIDAGITGEKRNDPRECEKLMRSLGESEFGDNRGPNRGPPRGFNPDCKKIENSEERLKCYDGALQEFGSRENFQGQGDYEQRFRETKEREKQCAESCSAKGGAWSFYNGECVCRQPEFREERREEFREGEGFRPPSGCEGLSPEECARKFSSGELGPPPGGFPPEFRPPEGEFAPPPGFSPPSGEGGNQEPPQTESPPSESGEGSSGGSGSGESGSSGGEGSTPGSGGGITGGVIFTDNSFLDYYFK